jgi:hypothetical protein
MDYWGLHILSESIYGDSPPARAAYGFLSYKKSNDTDGAELFFHDYVILKQGGNITNEDLLMVRLTEREQRQIERWHTF